MQFRGFCDRGIEKLATCYGKCSSSGAEYIEMWWDVSALLVTGENQEPKNTTYPCKPIA
jgi:hypothetical protein